MRSLRIAVLLAIVALPLTAAAPALADPNISVWDYTCSRGAETTSFSASAIEQNQTLAGHLLDGSGIAHTVRATVSGQIVFDIPGQSGKPDVWTCGVAQLGSTVVLSVRLSPRG